MPLQPEEIALDIRYEDADLLVINKPAGLVVHPGAGQPAGTLQNALLYFDAKLVEIRARASCTGSTRTRRA